MNKHTTQVSISVIALVSAVLNFAGLVTLVPDTSWWLKSLCALTSVGVWVALCLFWSYAFAAVPNLRLKGKRLQGWGGVLAGCCAVIALSTYWNLVALAGTEVRMLTRQSVAVRAEAAFQVAIRQAAPSLQVLPPLSSLASHLGTLATSEETGGGITGSKGKGGVSDTLRQLQSRLEGIAATLRQAKAATAKLIAKGQTCLNKLRAAVATTSSADGISAPASCVNRVIGALSRDKMAAQVAGDMRGLTAGLVVPVSLKSRSQHKALANILAGVQAQANGIADTARSIKPAAPRFFTTERPNVPAAVLLYWRQLIPAIATALALDLTPLIVLVFLVLVYRDAEASGKPRHPWTVAELSEARNQLDALGGMRPVHRTRTALKTALGAPARPFTLTADGDWWDVSDLHDGDRS